MSLKLKVPKVTHKCHPEAQPKDLANEREILHFAQNDSEAVTLAHFATLLYLGLLFRMLSQRQFPYNIIYCICHIYYS
jgi:hypothetical protein